MRDRASRLAIALASMAGAAKPVTTRAWVYPTLHPHWVPMMSLLRFKPQLTTSYAHGEAGLRTAAVPKERRTYDCLFMPSEQPPDLRTV
ncbi:hypothetical protein SAMN05444161_4737 [Rhizobiales bacterium GAS191]|nr:hypothetical protein SAMN05444161_4737 [Rhizobiales bacterium GAS191]